MPFIKELFTGLKEVVHGFLLYKSRQVLTFCSCLHYRDFNGQLTYMQKTRSGRVNTSGKQDHLIRGTREQSHWLVTDTGSKQEEPMFNSRAHSLISPWDLAYTFYLYTNTQWKRRVESFCWKCFDATNRPDWVRPGCSCQIHHLHSFLSNTPLTSFCSEAKSKSSTYDKIWYREQHYFYELQ